MYTCGGKGEVTGWMEESGTFMGGIIPGPRSAPGKRRRRRGGAKRLSVHLHKHIWGEGCGWVGRGEGKVGKNNF